MNKNIMNSNSFKISFEDLLRDKEKSQELIHTLVEELQETGWWQWFLNELNRNSHNDGKSAFPDQGLIKTPYDGVNYDKIHIISLDKEDEEFLDQTLKAWLYYLFLFNHPSRLEQLFLTDQNDFVPPQKKNNELFNSAIEKGHAIAITQLALAVDGSAKERTKRTERFCQGPFVKLGKQARAIFVGSANPEVFGSSAAIASLAQVHCLAAVPRDGYFSNVERQAALAKNVFTWINKSPVLNKIESEASLKLLTLWLHNVMGVLEASPDKAIRRARVLYDAGVRTFRVYSPEPGTGPLHTVSKLRSLEKKLGWEPIEIFAGQIVSVNQAKQLQEVSADGLFVGIGGGGRCITGVRSGATINWPQLLWELRGEIDIPVIVEGGASDHIAQTLAVGATGIGVTRAAGGGTIESPGGFSYLVDEQGNIFKIYGGEASARVKYMGGREGPFETIPYVEGESTTVLLDYGRGNFPTILQKLFLLFGDTILSMVFQNQASIQGMQDRGAENIRLVDPAERNIRFTH